MDYIQVGFFESSAGAVGEMWRTAGWMAALVSTTLLGQDLHTHRISYTVEGLIDGPIRSIWAHEACNGQWTRHVWLRGLLCAYRQRLKLDAVSCLRSKPGSVAEPGSNRGSWWVEPV